MRTHLDLFSGIGGFALAARANGVRTVQFVEIDPRCRAFLAKAWPGVPIWDDVRTFAVAYAKGLHPRRKQVPGSRQEGRTTPAGVGEIQPVWLLTAGVPCQPASRAGKQRGKADDRWLWPDTLRVIGQVQPTWALCENPPGIGDVGLNGILSALEAQNYEVRVVSIPACAVNAPHRRERFYIIGRHIGVGQADSEEARREGLRAGRMGDAAARRQEQDGPITPCGEVSMGNSEPEREQRRAMPTGGKEGPFSGSDRPVAPSQWKRFVWLPCADGKVRRAPDDSFSLVDGLHRSLLGALGNSIVPQVAAEIIRAMIQADETAP